MDKCEYCKVNDVLLNKKGKPLRYCSKSCQHSHTIQKRNQTNIARYGTTNPMMLDEVKEKRKNTNIARYGTDKPFLLPEIQEKYKATCRIKFGVDFPSQSEGIRIKQKEAWVKYKNNHPLSDNLIRKKRETTLFDKFGVKHPILHPEIKKKIEQTNLKIYGCPNAASSSIVTEKISQKLNSSETKEKIIQTNLERYGVPYYNQKNIKEALLILEDSNKATEIITTLGMTGAAQFLNVSIDTIRKYVLMHEITIQKRISDFEIQVANFLAGLLPNSQIVKNDRTLIGKELDIYIPDYNIAIECNGLYWHSELNGKTSNYHIEKTKQCKENNVRLLHIWENDWNIKQPIVKSRLSSVLGKNTTVYARKCMIKEVNTKDTQEFLSNNHLQGYCASSVKLGLYENNKLVSLMTFGKSRFTRKYDYELIRYCNKLGINVVGGASKLFAYFIKQYSPKNVVSYSSIDFNTGEMYSHLGFKKTHSSCPAYYYTKNYLVLENRIKYQKHKLKKILPIYDDSLSEWDNMKLNGYDRIWDCGNDVWLWESLY